MQLLIPENLPTIKGERQQIEQLLLNLVSNAHHALNSRFPGQNPNKSLRISVGYQPEPGSGRIQIELYDQGVGIAKDHLDKVFDPFFTTKPAGVGTGLGLNLCHEIVKRHKGELGIESEQGKFTCVRVKLPVAD